MYICACVYNIYNNNIYIYNNNNNNNIYIYIYRQIYIYEIYICSVQKTSLKKHLASISLG